MLPTLLALLPVLTPLLLLGVLKGEGEVGVGERWGWVGGKGWSWVIEMIKEGRWGNGVGEEGWEVAVKGLIGDEGRGGEGERQRGGRGRLEGRDSRVKEEGSVG